MKDNYPKTQDPSGQDHEVSTKQANRPFLAYVLASISTPYHNVLMRSLLVSYAQYREGRQKAHDEWLKRKEERELKLARGEDVGPEEPDPLEEPEVGCLGLLKFIVISLAVIVLASKFFTGSYLWEQDLSGIRKLIPVSATYSMTVASIF